VAQIAADERTESVDIVLKLGDQLLPQGDVQQLS
jgi:hypothetical protein